MASKTASASAPARVPFVEQYGTRLLDLLERMAPAAPSGILGAPMSSSTASLTVALGDANANGKADVSVSATILGRTMPALVIDIGFLDGLNLVTELHRKLGGMFAKVSRAGSGSNIKRALDGYDD